MKEHESELIIKGQVTEQVTEQGTEQVTRFLKYLNPFLFRTLILYHYVIQGICYNIQVDMKKKITYPINK